MSKIFHSRILQLVFCIASLFAANAGAQSTPAPIPDDPDPGYLNFIAGGREFGEGGPAIRAFIPDWAQAIDLDAQGRVYVGSPVSNILRVNHDGSISTFAQLWPLLGDFVIRNGYLYYITFPNFTEEAELIFRVSINSGETETYSMIDPAIVDECCDGDSQIEVDSSGNVYLHHANKIFKIAAGSGQATHIAGNGDRQFVGDTMPAIDAAIDVADMVYDPASDSLVIGDAHNRRIYRITPATGDIVSTEKLDVENDQYSLFTISSVDIHPSGDIYFTATDKSLIYRLSSSLTGMTRVAGNGVAEHSGDGGPALSAGIKPEQLTIVANGDIYFTTQAFSESMRVRRVDTGHDIVSTIVGIPGFLGCASPFDSFVVFTNGIDTDANGTIYTQSFNAILAFDVAQGITYTVAGIYGTQGDSEDGVPAFGSALRPLNHVSSGIAVAPDGDIYLVEEDRLRSIQKENGLLDTLASGKYRMPKYHANGSLYAVRDRGSWVDFVKINLATGVVSNIVEGGSGIPVVGESVAGRAFTNVKQTEPGYGGGRNLNDIAIDAQGNIYLSVNADSAPGLPSGIYKIDAQTRILSAVVTEAADSTRVIYGSMGIDTSRNFIYYIFLQEGGFDGDEFAPVVKVDLATGQQTRLAGANFLGDGYDRSGASMDPLDAWLHPIGISVAENGDVYVVQSQDSILKISPSTSLAPTLIPGDIVANSNTGQAVARSGNWLAVGVPNSPQSDGDTGEVLVYQDNDCRPILRDRLKVPGDMSASEFGGSLTFAGNKLVISASSPSGATVQGKGSPGSSPDANSTEADPAFQLGVFGLKNGRNWTLDQDLTSALPPASGGKEVSLVSDGNSFALGSPGANNGQGEVLVFNANNLNAPVSVKPSEAGATNFGKSVAMSGNQLAVGQDSNSSGAAVEAFQNNGGDYASRAIIPSPDESADFASALVVDDEAIYVGSPRIAGGRVFGYSLSDMSLADTVSDPKDASNPSFGRALAMENGILVVGAPDSRVLVAQAGHSSAESSGKDSKPEDTAANGAVFVFGVKNPSGGRQNAVPLSFLPATSSEEAYGKAVEITDGRIVVGAPESDDGRGTFDSAGDIVSAADLSGLWYDPSLDGEGYNLLVAGAGVVVFFYGYATNGERLWLISDTITNDIRFGEDINVKLYKAVEGEFAAPVGSSQALVDYGVLTMSFGSLRSATFTINGFDGNKISRLSFLADTTANAAAFSGLWYDAAKDGEGFNVISGKPGTVIYYYGSSKSGERLWLISDLLTNAISDGTTVKGKMYEATGGDFYHPAPSSTSLKDWGTIEALFNDCDDGKFILSGTDGNKTSDVIKLAGVDGAVCN